MLEWQDLNLVAHTNYSRCEHLRQHPLFPIVHQLAQTGGELVHFVTRIARFAYIENGGADPNTPSREHHPGNSLRFNVRPNLARLKDISSKRLGMRFYLLSFNKCNLPFAWLPALRTPPEITFVLPNAFFSHHLNLWHGNHGATGLLRMNVNRTNPPAYRHTQMLTHPTRPPQAENSLSSVGRARRPRRLAALGNLLLRVQKLFGGKSIDFLTRLLTFASMKATMTSKGQITIPARIRQKLGLSAGAVLNFDEQADHLKATKVADLHRMRSAIGLARKQLARKTTAAWIHDFRGPVDLPPVGG